MSIATFRLLTASLLQAIRSTDCTVSFISQRLAVIGAFRSSYCSIVPASSCSLSGPLLYRSPVVVFLDHGYPCFRNFNSTIPVDVVRLTAWHLHQFKSRTSDFVLRSTYLPYNGSIYERDGAAMGSPISAVIANLNMEIFEEQAIESAPCKPKIWKRYVDDTFTILDRDRVDVSCNTWTVNNHQSISPWRSRTTTRSPFSTRQFTENLMAALPPVSTGNQHILIST